MKASATCLTPVLQFELHEYISGAIPFGPFSRASSAVSGSRSFSEFSVWVVACPFTDSISLETAAFTFEDVGKEAPAATTSCCFCNAAYKSRNSKDMLTKTAKT